MNAIVRPVLNDEHVFVPEIKPIASIQGILQYSAVEEPEPTAEAKPIQVNEAEPYGMYWHRQYNTLVLRPHGWFLKQVASTAEQVLTTGMTRFGTDEETQGEIRQMASALKDYIECRRAINTMAGDRKMKGEADDACYQLAQAAKYFIDATEAAQRCIDAGYNVDDNRRISALKERAEVAMREGYMIAQAVIIAADKAPPFDLSMSAKRVVEYSCRKLTEWFAANRVNAANRDATRNAGAALALAKFFDVGCAVQREKDCAQLQENLSTTARR